MQQSVKAAFLALLFAIIATNTMPPSAISADNKARIENLKVSDIQSMSDFKEKVYQELVPDLSSPENANWIARRIENSSGVMKELWIATQDLCNRKPEIAEAKYMKHLPELAKQLPEINKLDDDAVIKAEIHNIRVLWATSELLTNNFQAAQGIFEQLGREDKDKCETLRKEYYAIGGKDSSNSAVRARLGKKLQRYYKYRYYDHTGTELAWIGQMLTKQCKPNASLLEQFERNRTAIKKLGDFDYSKTR